VVEGVEYPIKLSDFASGPLSRLILRASELDRGIDALNRDLDKLSKPRRLNIDTSGITRAQQQANGLAGMAGRLGGLLAGAGAVALGRSAIQVQAEREAQQRAIVFASGSEGLGRSNVEFVRRTAATTGGDFSAGLEGFTKIIASARGTGVELGTLRTLFDGVSRASNKLGLDSESQKGIFLALGQVMSKGKVQAEELRGQIGERLPGAFNIAARAMGVTTAQLDKMMQDGLVPAGVFIEKFANQLSVEFGGELEQTLATRLNRLSTAWDTFLTGLGQRLDSSFGYLLDRASTLFQSLGRNLSSGQDEGTRQGAELGNAILGASPQSRAAALSLNRRLLANAEAELSAQLSLRAQEERAQRETAVGPAVGALRGTAQALFSPFGMRDPVESARLEVAKRRALIQELEGGKLPGGAPSPAAVSGNAMAEAARTGGQPLKIEVNISRLIGVENLGVRGMAEGAKAAGDSVVGEVLRALNSVTTIAPLSR
jgi:tape measure domain-containing protein